MMMHTNQMAYRSGLYDPDLPTAGDVMASLCCVATQYASEPSLDLALLGYGLAQTLTAPEYAETDLIVTVSKQLLDQWQSLLQAHQEFELQQHSSEYVPQSLTVQ
ncbi:MULTISPECIES: hypothetical protein [unclassified Methylotenera]|jgi:hypothetical protein|uniref:hypothetical protein n=1 Tax=unclassified Methylotenera TaxID=2643294 RepID=UPI0003678753|nr:MULTISPECIES: hypothetical protein [unclassified Methylotenera]